MNQKDIHYYHIPSTRQTLIRNEFWGMSLFGTELISLGQVLFDKFDTNLYTNSITVVLSPLFFSPYLHGLTAALSCIRIALAYL